MLNIMNSKNQSEILRHDYLYLSREGYIISHKKTKFQKIKAKQINHQQPKEQQQDNLKERNKQLL